MAGNSTPPWNPMAATQNAIGQMLPSGFTAAGGGPSQNYADPNANSGIASYEANQAAGGNEWQRWGIGRENNVGQPGALTMAEVGKSGTSAPADPAAPTAALTTPSGAGVEGSALQQAIATALQSSSGTSAPAAPAPAQNQNYGMGTQLNNSPTETNPDNGEQFVNQYTTLGDG